MKSRNKRARHRYENPDYVAPDTNDISACNRKIQYASKALAKIAATTNTRRFGKEMHAYECPNCSKFHLTSLDPETERRRKRRLAA